MWPDLVITNPVFNMESLGQLINFDFSHSSSRLVHLVALDVHLSISELNVVFPSFVANSGLNHSVKALELGSLALAFLLDFLAVAHQVKAIWVTTWGICWLALLACVQEEVAFSI